MKIVKHVHKILNDARVKSRPPLLLVGVSGGADSLTLLHILSQTNLYHNEHLIVVHVNHRLRPSAFEEAEFVSNIAQMWGVEWLVREMDVAAFAQANKLSLEEAGRVVRYQIFNQVASQVGAQVIAVAHNADDQAETVLMNFLRGSGIGGLKGMDPISLLPETNEEYLLIRPLLNVWRAEIDAYCRNHLLTPVQDETNSSADFLRNRIRHELLPLLSDYNPNIKKGLVDNAIAISADYDLLQSLTQETWRQILIESKPNYLLLDLTKWQELHLSLRRHTLRQVVEVLSSSLQNVSFETIENARAVLETGKVGSRAKLPNGVTLIVEYDAVTATRTTHLPHLEANNQDLAPLLLDTALINLSLPASIPLSNGSILQVFEQTNINIHEIKENENNWSASLAVPPGTQLYARPRQPGETIAPLGMKGKHKKIKKIMIDQKIPVAHRGRWPIIADDKGALWIAGHTLAERAAVTAASQRVIQCKIVPKERLRKTEGEI